MPCVSRLSSANIHPSLVHLSSIRVLHTSPNLENTFSDILALNQIHDLQLIWAINIEIFVDFVKTRPTSDLELVFKDHAGVQYQSKKFENGVLVHWDVDIHVRTHTSATLTVRRLDRAHFQRVAELSVKIKPDEFGDDRIVCLEGSDALLPVRFTSSSVFKDSNHRVTVTFVCGGSRSATIPNIVAPIDTQQPHRRIPEFSFRVLIIGRANAGKTSILQRICETTESPIIYRGNEEVRSPILFANLIQLPTRLHSTLPWTEASTGLT
ncbi:hypothetical protein EDB92DRAFT_2107960, partial [Lactarius akahatsu]